jgi:hypothetical protein
VAKIETTKRVYAGKSFFLGTGGVLSERKEKCIHVSTRFSPRSYPFPLRRFYSLPLSQFSYSRLFADGKVSNPTRRRRKMYANHSATIWLSRLCCVLGGREENGFLSKKKTRNRFSMDRFVFPPLTKEQI